MYANHTTVAEVVQHLPPVEQSKVFRMLDRRAQKNPRFRDIWDAAKSKKAADDESRDEWLCKMAADRESYHMIDVPF